MEMQMIDTEKKAERETFIRFPFDLYRDDPFWVPPFPGEMQSAMDRQTHPFYRHSTADFFHSSLGKRNPRPPRSTKK